MKKSMFGINSLRGCPVTKRTRVSLYTIIEI